MTYKLEPARLEHLPWLRMMFMRWVEEQPADYPFMDAEEFDNFVVTLSRHMLTRGDEICCYVAIKGRRVVGFIASEITTRAVGKPHRSATVHWLYVIPKHRKQGVAAQLIHAGMEWAIACGIETVEIIEAEHQRGKWIERSGFRPYTTHYWLPFDTIYKQSQEHIAGKGKPSMPKLTNGAAHP